MYIYVNRICYSPNLRRYIGLTATKLHMLAHSRAWRLGVHLTVYVYLRIPVDSFHFIPSHRSACVHGRRVLVHGRWSYRRVSKLAVYMFYKNVVLVMPQYYLAIYSLFSGSRLLIRSFLLFIAAYVWQSRSIRVPYTISASNKHTLWMHHSSLIFVFSLSTS